MLTYSVSAQDTTENQKLNRQVSRVRWISQYPSGSNEFRDKKLSTRIIEFITGGKTNLHLSKPVSVVASDPDTFWVLDQGNGVIFAVRNKLGDIPHFIEKKSGDFRSMVWLSRFSGNRFLITDSYLNKIFISDPARKELTVLNDTLQLLQPTGIAWSAATGRIWVVETKAHCIRIMDEKGLPLRTIGSRGNGAAEFNFPTSIWIDSAGIAYVVDAMNFRIQVFSPSGDFLYSFGEIGDATGYLARPKGIATDSYGNIYVADALFHTIQIFDKKGHFLYNFGSQGRGEGEFWMPSGIYIDSKDYIYVADSYNSRVQVFQLLNGEKNE